MKKSMIANYTVEARLGRVGHVVAGGSVVSVEIIKVVLNQQNFKSKSRLKS